MRVEERDGPVERFVCVGLRWIPKVRELAVDERLNTAV